MEDIAHAETDKLISEMGRKIAREYRRASDEAQRKLDDYLSKFAKRDEQWRIAVDNGEKSEEDYEKWRVNQMMTGKRWEAMRDTLADDYHNANLIARSVVNGYTPEAYALNHNYGTYLIEHDSMMDTSYTLYNRQTVERILREDPQLLPEPGKELQKKIEANKDLKWQEGQIQSVTMQSILQGDSIPKMAKRISETMGDKNCGNAVSYARTAMTGAQNAGRHDSYVRAKNMGIDVVQMWLATLDDRTRDAHRQLDGQTVGPNEAFEVDGAQLDYPGDPSAPAYLVWNCRCTTVPQIKGFEWSASDMSLRYNEKLGDMSYDEWKEDKAKPQKVEPVTSTTTIVNGKDISGTWERRPEQFDFEIEDVMNAQGFDGLPRVVGKEEFDAFANESPYVAQRVYSAPDQTTLDAYRDQLYNGEWYVDCSSGGAALGRGMYTAAVDDMSGLDRLSGEMKQYARGASYSYTETMCFDKSFRSIDYDVLSNNERFIKELIPDLKRQHPDFSECFDILKTGDRFDMMDYASEHFSNEKAKELRGIMKELSESMASEDYGARAVKFGFDGIIGQGAGGPDVDYLVVLNRTKVIILGG